MRNLALVLGCVAAFSIACERKNDETQVRPEPAAATRPESPRVPAPEQNVTRVPLGSVLHVAGLHQGAMERDFGVQEPLTKISVKITKPESGALVTSDNVDLEMTVDGYDTDAAHGGMQVMIDDLPSEPYYDAGEKPMRIDLKKRDLKPGLHLIRAFAVRPWRESIKDERAFAASYFYYRQRTSDTVNVSRPMLTYDGPSGTYHVTPKTNRILLDYVVTGTQLDDRGYKVRYTIDNMQPVVLTSWAPVWLEALPPGNHVAKLEFVDKDDRIVPSSYSKAESRFTIVMDGKEAK